MKKRFTSVVRKVGLLAGAGILLQAGACSVALNDAAQSIALGTMTNLLSNIVFGAFNLQ